MRSYTYLFAWKNAEGVFEKKYIEAPSLQMAKDDFERTFKVGIIEKKVKFTRVRN